MDEKDKQRMSWGLATERTEGKKVIWCYRIQQKTHLFKVVAEEDQLAAFLL